MISHSWLEPETSKVLGASVSNRVQWLQIDYHWVNTPDSKSAFQWMEFLYRSAPIIRPQCLHIVGNPGYGKSAILTAFAEIHPSTESTEAVRTRRPVLCVNCTLGDSGVKGLWRAILRSAWPGARNLDAHCTREEVDRTLSCQGVKIILGDEVGEILKCGRTGITKVLGELRRLSSENKINLVCATTKSFENVFMQDEQLRDRFVKKVELKPWSESQEFRDFLSGYEAYLPFPKRSHLDQKRVVDWFIRNNLTSNYDVTTTLRMAGMYALSNGLTYIGMKSLNEARLHELPPKITICAA